MDSGKSEVCIVVMIVPSDLIVLVDDDNTSTHLASSIGVCVSFSFLSKTRCVALVTLYLCLIRMPLISTSPVIEKLNVYCVIDTLLSLRLCRVILYHLPVTLGFNISQRRRRKSAIGAKHRITKDECMKWFQQKVSSKSVEMVLRSTLHFY